MNEGLKKFEELMKTDTAFQEKLKAAMKNYTGEQTEQAVFDGVLVPLAKEYGITASFEEFKGYVTSISNTDRELNEDEVNQVAGGRKGVGAGMTLCYGVGAGLGSTDGDTCIIVGVGGTTSCVAEGQVVGC